MIRTMLNIIKRARVPPQGEQGESQRDPPQGEQYESQRGPPPR